MKRIGEKLLDWLYPPRCIFCEQILPIQGERHSCIECYSHLPWNEGTLCQICGKSIPDEKNICYECSAKKPYFIQGFGVFRYEGMVQDALYRFKYGGHREYGKDFAAIIEPYLAKYIQSLPIDIIIPVPLHKKRQRQRGYNQAEQIGKYIGQLLKIPMENHILLRSKDTPPQSQLSAFARWNNSKDAFTIIDNSKIKGKFILLIDDIYTTGSTINACSKALVEQGVAGVYFLALSMGVYHRNK